MKKNNTSIDDSEDYLVDAIVFGLESLRSQFPKTYKYELKKKKAEFRKACREETGRRLTLRELDAVLIRLSEIARSKRIWN